MQNKKRTSTADEMFHTVFMGNELVNTKIVKRGKLQKNIAFEVAQDNYPYSDYSKSYITIICNDENTAEVLEPKDFGCEPTYPTSEAALAAITQAKKNLRESNK